MASHTHFRQYFNTNKCDRQLTLSYEPVSISNNLTFFHTTIKMPIQLTMLKNHPANHAKKWPK